MKRAVSLMVALTALGGVWVLAQPSQLSIADEFRMVEVASVADAIEQLYGERALHVAPDAPAHGDEVRRTGRHGAAEKGRAQGRIARRRRACSMRSTRRRRDRYTSWSSSAQPLPVRRATARDYAGIGGLMATAMKYRGFAGAVIDASVRDTPQIRRLQFPVFSRGVVPSTTINHFRVTGVNVPVICAGVRVNPGDIVTADEDGVAVVPIKRVQEVLKKAQELDDTEHRMYPFIEKFRSIREAVKQFGRI